MALLFESGADLNIRNRNGKTPLDLALDNGRLDIAKFLVERMGCGGSQDRIALTRLEAVSQEPPSNVAQPLFGRDEGTSIQDEMIISLHTASMKGDLEIVRGLLDGRADVNERDTSCRTPLLCASMVGSAEVAKSLIKYGADVNFRERTGWAPLHIASYYGHLDFVHLLLGQGADVNAKNVGSWTALHFASNFGYFEIVKALLNGEANVHARNDEGRTPTEVASRAGSRDIVQLLAEHDSDARRM